MVVSAAPQANAESLDDNTPAAQKQATLGNLGKRKLLDVPWAVQTMSDSLIRQQQLPIHKLNDSSC